VIRCDAVYTSWARASVLSRAVADEVLVAEVAGEVAGFLTLKFATPEVGEGPLYGVAADHQGQGLGRALMAHGLRWLQARGAAWMQMSTQVTNTRSQRIWLRLGFEPSHSSYTFHRWFD
jgi:ribosomal protein S18 acetylase RimI-like enzyme